MSKSKTNSIPSSPPLPKAKAGIVLFGKNAAGEQSVLAPYTEGRFGNNDKYYGIAAGSVDAGEDALGAALREAQEETGVDFHKLLGEDNIAKLRRGERVENVESGYPGVTIKQVMPNALDYIYNGRSDLPNHLVMFGIEIEGIEKLVPALKNQESLVRDGEIDQVVHPVRSTVDDTTKYPSFKDCLKWLRDQKIPEGSWTRGKAGVDLLLEGKEISKDWFRNLEKKYNDGDEILTIPQWQKFRSKLPEADYNLIGTFADAMKSQLTEMGVIGKDHSEIKFDAKDCPFKFYQEGADIISAHDYLYNCLKRSASRKDYNRAFSGATPAMEEKKAPRVERITQAQLATVVWATPKEDISAVAGRFGHKPPKTRDGIFMGGSAHDGEQLKFDLLGVKDTMDRKVKPITTVIQPEHYGKAPARHAELS